MNNMKAKKPRHTLKEMFGKRSKAGSYSAFAAVVVIAIAVVVNMVVGALPTSITQPDITDQALYTLSSQTKQIASSVTEDVNLYLLASSGSEDSTIERLLQRYAELSDHIHYEAVDPGEKPTFLNAYDLTTSQLYQNSVLVDCNGRYRLVSYTDIYVTEYSMDYSTYNYTSTTEFDGENALTNAIHYVTNENLPKVYTLSGHGETELDSSVTEMLEQDNMEIESLSLLSMDAVPEDASAIIIQAPQSDLSEDEATALIEYLDNGGSIALITSYIDEGEMTNLLSVTQHMGMTAQTGLVIEGDSNMHMSRYPYYLLPDIESHTITDDLIDEGYYILLPTAQGIADAEGSDAEVTYLLTTSDSAYGKAAGMNAQTTEAEDDDIAGPFHLAAASELGEGKLFWIASGDVLNENVDRTVAGANSNLFSNAISWMCDQPESISIRAKSLDTSTLTLTAAESSRWSIIMIGVIPLALIAIGVTVCIRRKRR